MSSKRRNVALIAGFAVVGLIAASLAFAQGQSGQQASSFRFGPENGRTFTYQAEELSEQLREAERAFAMAQEMRVRPTVAFSNIWTARSGGLAGRALANADELALTQEQEQGIRELQRAHRREEIRRDADLEIAEMDLEEMMEADGGDLGAIEQKMREAASLDVDDRMANLRLDRSIRDLLTAEQNDQLDELSPGRVLFEARGSRRDRR